MLEVKDKAPNFELEGRDGTVVQLSDFLGKKVVVYFYPKDNTPGCTRQACAFASAFQEYEDLGVKVIGISKDSTGSHQRFAAKYELPFILLSDEDTTVNQAFGVWQKKKMAGKEYMGTVRTTFITDANHIITHIIRKVNTKDAASQLLEVIGGTK